MIKNTAGILLIILFISTGSIAWNCNNCGSENAESHIFCFNCGKKHIKPKFCPDCGEPYPAENGLCEKCKVNFSERHKPAVSLSIFKNQESTGTQEGITVLDYPLKKILVSESVIKKKKTNYLYKYTHSINAFLKKIPGYLTPPQSKKFCYSVSSIYGIKHLRENDWKPGSRQKGTGLKIDFGLKDWPVLFVLEYITAADKSEGISNITDSQDFILWKTETEEICFGLKKYFRRDSLSYSVSGGLVRISSGRQSPDGIKVKNAAGWFWFAGEILHDFSTGFHGGLELKYSMGKAILNDRRIESGGLYYGIFAGVHSW